MACASVCLITVATGACRRDDPVRPRPAASQHVTIAIPSLVAPDTPLLFVLTQTRLIRLDATGVEQPAFIERWSSSPDGLTWTLVVRPDERLHDGTQATAADVAARIREAAASPDAGPGLWPVVGVDALDDHRVRIRLKEPTSLLLETLALAEALPAGAYRNVAPPDAPPSLRAVVRAGEPAPAIGSVDIKRYDTPRAAVVALLRGEVDVLYEVPGEARALLDADGGVRIYPHVKPYVLTLGLNHRHPLLARREVRLALNAAIDRRALVTSVPGGVGVPAADLLWHQHWSRPHADDGRLLRHDPAAARAWLDSVGLTRRVDPGGVVKPRLTLRCLVLDEPLSVQVAARLQQAYDDVGIALDLEAVSLEQLLTRLETGKFETFVSPMVSGYGMGMAYLQYGPHDRPRIVDDGYVAGARASEAIRRASSREALAAAIADLHRVLIDDPPAVHLFWQETSRAVGRRITVPAEAGDVLASLPRWGVVTPP